LSAIPNVPPSAGPEAAARAPAPQGVRARYFNVYRLAAYFLVFYTLGHTLGAVVATPRFGSESDSVVSAMKSVHVVSQGFDCTWYGFYRGMSGIVSLFFIFSTVMTWHLGGMAAGDRRAFAPVTWAFFLTFAASIGIVWAYFFPLPIFFSTVITLLLGIGCIRDLKAGRKSTAGNTANRQTTQISSEVSNGVSGS
jgi:hypothetical protein